MIHVYRFLIFSNIYKQFGMLWQAIPSIPSKKSLSSALSVPLRGCVPAGGVFSQKKRILVKALCSALSVPLRGCVPCRGLFVSFEKTTTTFKLFTEAGGLLVPGGLGSGAPQRMNIQEVDLIFLNA